jgi:hypothetical protein
VKRGPGVKIRLAFVAAFAAVCLPSWAQESINGATVSGRVMDSTGAVIAGTRVSAHQAEANSYTEAVTDSEGRFRFGYLRPGTYTIAVKRPGFADAARSLQLTAASAFSLSFVLALASAQASVNVESEGPIIEAARTQLAGTIPRSEIADVPLNGRNFLDLALLQPGVSPTNTASTQLFPETSAVPGQGISVGSQRNFSNNFLVDGVSANDDAAGLAAVALGLDSIAEFQVIGSGGQAELGRALGGYVNVVTRSGTNELHGDFYGYFRNQRMNAANALSRTKLPMTQAQFGASLGGPVIRDRVFYFANIEQRSLNQSGLVTISPANAAAINARLIEVGYQGPLVTTGMYSNPVHATTALGKMDFQASTRDQVSLRYNAYRVESANSRGAGALSAPSAATGLDDLDHSVALSNIWTLSPRIVNETRGQIVHSSLEAQPNDTAGPAVSIAGVASFGRLSFSPAGRANDLYEIADNLSLERGAHDVRLGANVLYNATTITFPRSNRGSYSFSSLGNFLNGLYNNAGFTQTFGPQVVSQGNPNAAFFAQDEWRPHPSVTVNGGLRYELQFLETIATDTNNFAPRLGIAWSPWESRQTVLRVNWGLFYDRVPLRALANALLSSGNTTQLTSASQVSVSLSPTQAGAPVFPNILTALPSAVVANFSTMDRHMQNAYSTQASIQMEHKLSARSTISVAYEHLRGLHLIASINQNAPSCIASGNNNGCRPNPAYANNSQYSPAADSRYNALMVSFIQRPAKWGSYRLSYTYSKALTDVGEFFFSSPIDNFNIWRDWGRSDDDQRHRLVFDGTARYRGFQLSGMLQYYSALPFNITAGSNTVQGTAARPTVNGEYIPRNAGTGFDFLNLNLRLSREFRIGESVRLNALAESFNSLNRVNGVALNGTFGPGAYPAAPLPTFGQTTAVADPRSVQLALRLGF